MSTQTKIIIGLGGALCITLYFLLTGYREHSKVRLIADSLARQEKLHKALSDLKDRSASQHALEASRWKAKYDSATFAASLALEKARQKGKIYEDLLKTRRVFATDAQRDSILTALYPH